MARSVRKFILKNSLQPGDRLPTHDVLCRELGVGLLPLREGLGILVQHGLVVTRRRGGTVVAAPSVRALGDPVAWHLEARGYAFEDLVAARAAIEGAVAAVAAERRTAKDLLVMLTALDALQAITQQGPEHEKADERFHLAVLDAAHNPVMRVFGELIVVQFHRKAVERLRASPQQFAQALAEHRTVFDAIERRDADAARRRMSEHVVKQMTESPIPVNEQPVSKDIHSDE